MAMLQWNPIREDYSAANSLLADAGTKLSNVGTALSKIQEQILEQQKIDDEKARWRATLNETIRNNDLENAYKLQALEETARNNDMSYMLGKGNLEELIRAHNMEDTRGRAQLQITDNYNRATHDLNVAKLKEDSAYHKAYLGHQADVLAETIRNDLAQNMLAKGRLEHDDVVATFNYLVQAFAGDTQRAQVVYDAAIRKAMTDVSRFNAQSEADFRAHAYQYQKDADAASLNQSNAQTDLLKANRKEVQKRTNLMSERVAAEIEAHRASAIASRANAGLTTAQAASYPHESAAKINASNASARASNASADLTEKQAEAYPEKSLADIEESKARTQYTLANTDRVRADVERVRADTERVVAQTNDTIAKTTGLHPEIQAKAEALRLKSKNLSEQSVYTNSKALETDMKTALGVMKLDSNSSLGKLLTIRDAWKKAQKEGNQDKANKLRKEAIQVAKQITAEDWAKLGSASKNPLFKELFNIEETETSGSEASKVRAEAQRTLLTTLFNPNNIKYDSDSIFVADARSKVARRLTQNAKDVQRMQTEILKQRAIEVRTNQQEQKVSKEDSKSRATAFFNTMASWIEDSDINRSLTSLFDDSISIEDKKNLVANLGTSLNQILVEYGIDPDSVGFNKSTFTAKGFIDTLSKLASRYILSGGADNKWIKENIPSTLQKWADREEVLRKDRENQENAYDEAANKFNSGELFTTHRRYEPQEYYDEKTQMTRTRLNFHDTEDSKWFTDTKADIIADATKNLAGHTINILSRALEENGLLRSNLTGKDKETLLKRMKGVFGVEFLKKGGSLKHSMNWYGGGFDVDKAVYMILGDKIVKSYLNNPERAQKLLPKLIESAMNEEWWNAGFLNRFYDYTEDTTDPELALKRIRESMKNLN